ncbi:hypothetical protein LOD99_9960 [Oopsacas minuta]|uniref:Pinin/SDK/MemA protein domain-containing protein n=1 Tax=Oopsacas minuta TaxID=111878 RepID=A0AAV7KIY2_9METZ|nr:hypothetical protein LOD99_9960 [Oopsacas minuta]
MTSINDLEASLLDTKNSLEEVNTQLKRILGWEEKSRQISNFKPESPPLLGKDSKRDSTSHVSWDKYTNKRRADDVFVKNEFPREKRIKHYNTPKSKSITMLNDSDIFRVSEKPQKINKDDDITIQRNRRMFGNIMTTLKQFQMTEVQNSTSNKEQRRREIAQKLDREDHEDKQAAANEKKELIKNKQKIKNQIMCFEEKIEIEKMVFIVVIY